MGLSDSAPLAGLLRVEQIVAESLVVRGGGHKRLSSHISVEDAGSVKRGHDILNQAVVVEDFLFYIALFVGGVAPGKALLHRKVSDGIEIQSHRFVLGVHDGNLVAFLLRSDSLPLIKQRYAGRV